nr:MAG TPA: DNA pilot protein VP2 [Microviridae sp.]
MSIALEQLIPINGYDVAIVSALIGALGAIGGAALGASSNNKNALQNQMNNEFNAREAQKARDFQLEMWNKQNEYNSPVNQRRLRAEAGYNPYLGYDSNTGVAGSTGSTSQAQAASPLAVNPEVYSELGSQLGRAGQMIYQERESNARVKALQGEADVTRAQAMQFFSNIDWGKLSPEYKKWMRETGLQRAQLDYDTNKQNLQNLRWSNLIQMAERTNLLLSVDTKRTLNKYLDQSEQTRINVMAAQYYDMMASGHLKYQQCKESIAKQLLMSKQGSWYDSMSNKNNLDYRNALALADDYIAAMSTQYESQTSYNMGFGSKAQEAGRRDAESKSFKSLIDRWNYNKRYYEEGLRTIGVVGNAIGSIRR